MAAYGLLTMYNLTASIGTKKTGEPSASWTYAELADGIDNIAEALNEVVQQYFFLSDDGFARHRHGPGFHADRKTGDWRRGAGFHFQPEVQPGHRAAVIFPAQIHRW